MKSIFRKVKEHNSSKKYVYGKIYLPKEYIGKLVEIKEVKKNV